MTAGCDETPLLVYVAGKYRGPDPWAVEQNIRAAEAVAYQIALAGAYPVTPHANTRGYFEGAQSDPAFWLNATLELMRRCDAAVLCTDWLSSYGATVERREALAMGLPVHEYADGGLALFLARVKPRHASQAPTGADAVPSIARRAALDAAVLEAVRRCSPAGGTLEAIVEATRATERDARNTPGALTRLVRAGLVERGQGDATTGGRRRVVWRVP